MSVRKDRIHRCGHSNIDFRSKRDEEALKVYQPWKNRTAFGTMGYVGFKLHPEENKKILEVSEKLNNQRTVLSEMPDPKYHKSAQFYFDKKIPIKEKTIYTNERVAQLDESFKGKEMFTGDSMMIADINKFRKAKKKKEYVDRNRKDKILKQEMIIKDKSSKNKEAIQETQLVNIDAEVTLEDKIDINKIKEIRLALRRRYANRTNFRKIFKDWDNSGAGEINLYAAHSMINKLGVPINYNETLALIASSNTRTTQTLNLEEFMHLIFSDNPAIDVDLKQFKFKEEKLYSEGEQIENLKKNMRNNIVEMSKTNEINFLKEYLRIRIPTLVKYFNEETPGEETCNLDSLSKVLKKFPINEKYTSEPLMRAIFDQFKIDDDKMNFRNYIENIIDSKEMNDFFNFKERYINNIKDKITRNQNVIQNSVNSLQAEEEAKKLLAKEFEKEIQNQKKKKEDESEKKEVINPLPSTEFINKIFANKDLYFQKHQELEKEFSAYPSVMKGSNNFNLEAPAKTRYGANPPHKNTFEIIQAPENAGTYISEKERFNVRGKFEVDFLAKEKERKKQIDLHKIEKMKEVNNRFANNAFMKEYMHDQKDIFSQLQRTKKLYKYEYVRKILNININYYY